jgi:hypothetical protein
MHLCFQLCTWLPRGIIANLRGEFRFVGISQLSRWHPCSLACHAASCVQERVPVVSPAVFTPANVHLFFSTPR